MPQSVNNVLVLDEVEVRPQGPRPDSDVARRVGNRVKSLRKARKISLVQLVEMTGLSVGLLSGLERGTVAPTLRSLTVIANAFGLPLSWFYDLEQGPHSGEVVLRSGMGRKFMWAEGIEKTLLNPDFGGNLEMVMVTIAPHTSSGTQSYTHEGEEGGYVLEGTFELWVDEKQHLLGPGDSFEFESKRAHRFGNPADNPCKLIWILTPPLYQGQT